MEAQQDNHLPPMDRSGQASDVERAYLRRWAEIINGMKAPRRPADDSGSDLRE